MPQCIFGGGPLPAQPEARVTRTRARGPGPSSCQWSEALRRRIRDPVTSLLSSEVPVPPKRSVVALVELLRTQAAAGGYALADAALVPGLALPPAAPRRYRRRATVSRTTHQEPSSRLSSSVRWRARARGDADAGAVHDSNGRPVCRKPSQRRA